ncbi:SRPBCC family protein [Nonomuraea longicatena]|uniref:Coenzyme Q-binding protein COQ10 START domain-containing protein n=1 Tax=Nonomuraea longicatena TaxID=83682 RepID=A0ABN1PV32_9ACTN
MSTIEHALNVNVPLRATYDQWTQFETFPQFMEGVESVRQVSDDPDGFVETAGDWLQFVRMRVHGDRR